MNTRRDISTVLPLQRSVLYLLLILLTTLSSCIDEKEYPDMPQGNFEALWHIIDEHYCFFEEKRQAFGLDWNEVYARYSRQMDPGMTKAQEFEVLTNMLGELRDGHVNLYSTFDTGRNWSWHEDFPANVSDTLLRKYLGTDYRMVSGLQYRVLDDNIGYLRCESFEVTFGAGNLDEIFMYLAPCRGLIIDLRGNGGGMVTSAEALAARFFNAPTHVGYIQHKTGRGHNDFSSLQKQTLKPGKGVRWQKRVAVLTNRQVFSAANEFVKYMKCSPLVTTVGDQTGGGAGLPFSSELPNGWSVRFSACPMYDANGVCTEQGIAPDYPVSLSDDDFLRGRDTIIEFARQLLSR